MIKRKTVETVEEFDESGKLTRKTITETTEDDSSPQVPWFYLYPWWGIDNPLQPNKPSITYTSDRTVVAGTAADVPPAQGTVIS